MSGSEKDRLAALVIEQHCAFEQALAGSRRRYPTHEFRSFAAVVRQYAEATREDEMLHRGVVSAVNGLVQYLQCERKKVPGEVLWVTDLNVCCSVATTRTSTATSLLASNSAWRHFSSRTVSIAGRKPTSQHPGPSPA